MGLFNKLFGKKSEKQDDNSKREEGNIFILNNRDDASAPQNFKKLWQESIEQLNSDKITIQEFVNINAEHPIFISTPAGPKADGKVIVWAKQHPSLNVSFYPAFLSAEQCLESFSKAGRKNTVVIEETLKGALDLLDSNPILQPLGLIVEDEGGRLTIPPKNRVTK